MDHEDIVDKVLSGLDYYTYKPIIDSINAMDSLISFEELHEKLITRELLANSMVSSPCFLAYVHAATYKVRPQHSVPATTAYNSDLLPNPCTSNVVAANTRANQQFLGK